MLFAMSAALVSAHAGDAPVVIRVDADHPGISVSPLMYGVFLEEINRAGDGGIYAELIQNRSFEDAEEPVAWTLLQEGGAEVRWSLDRSVPLRPRNPTSLRLDVLHVGERAAIANDGFRGVPMEAEERRDPEARTAWRRRFDESRNGGIPVREGRFYDLTFHARSTNDIGLVTASLESRRGTLLAEGTTGGIGPEWRKFSIPLRVDSSEDRARLILSVNRPGTVWLDMVSLFPRDTWKGRPNGLRPELMEALAELRPAFVRFPDRSDVAGETTTDPYRWKDFIGDVAGRGSPWSAGGYRSGGGLGYYEYLQMCEDLGAEPLFVIHAGQSGDAEPTAEASLREFVQDALDAIEYANGPVTSRWGALRAQHGHSAPFGLKMIQIGSGNSGPAYDRYYARLHDAIKSRYPNIRIIASDGNGVLQTRPIEMVDRHACSDVTGLLRLTLRLDDYDRSAPRVLFGEYAAAQGSGFGNLLGAVAEAAFLSGLERHADVVAMASYAPLLERDGWGRRRPGAIRFDDTRIVKTPSFWVQSLFATHRPDRLVPVVIEADKPSPRLAGPIGVGTWNTRAEFRDVRVTRGDEVLFEPDYARGAKGWYLRSGRWETEDDILRQMDDSREQQATMGDDTWTDYTLAMKARKLGGDEGFMIRIGTDADGNPIRWNLGGWGNTAHGIEAQDAPPRVPGRIETDRWYDLRIVVTGSVATCFLDGAQRAEYRYTVPDELFAVAGRDDRTGELLLKLVNTADRARDVAIHLGGNWAGEVTLLTHEDPLAENTFEQPFAVMPVTERMTAPGETWTRSLPAHSVTFARLARPQASDGKP